MDVRQSKIRKEILHLRNQTAIYRYKLLQQFDAFATDSLALDLTLSHTIINKEKKQRTAQILILDYRSPLNILQTESLEFLDCHLRYLGDYRTSSCFLIVLIVLLESLLLEDLFGCMEASVDEISLEYLLFVGSVLAVDLPVLEWGLHVTEFNN